MPDANLLFGRIGSIRRNANAAQVIDASAVVEDIDTTAVSQQATFVTPNDGTEYFLQITATGNVRLAFGVNPTAIEDAGPLVIGNTTRDFALAPGTTVAVINST